MGAVVPLTQAGIFANLSCAKVLFVFSPARGYDFEALLGSGDVKNQGGFFHGFFPTRFARSEQPRISESGGGVSLGTRFALR